MEKSDKYMADHVRSAKIWLEKAEQSFNSQSDIQGELNLMLAEAEMKNLRKKKRRTLGKRILAVCAVLACVGVGGMSALVLTHSHQEAAMPGQSIAVPKASVTTAVVPQAPPQTADSETQVPLEPVPAPAQEVSEPESAEPEEQAMTVSNVPDSVAAPAAEPVLSDREVQAAVQDARHVLRSASVERK